MDAIPAANNLSIEFGIDNWRLISHELDNPTTLVEATPEGLITHPVFMTARALPGASVSPAQIMRVVLGWAPENQAWRLGILLLDGAASKYDTTQMRWCELAEWHGENNPEDITYAKHAGQLLARLINRPFQYIEPNTESRVAIFTASQNSAPPTLSDTTPTNAIDTSTKTNTSLPHSQIASSTPSVISSDKESPQLGNNEMMVDALPQILNEEIPLPDIQPLTLPIQINHWKLLPAASGLRWQRVRSWWSINFGRLLLYGLLCILFLLLGIGSRTRGLASVEPNWLPFAGLIVGIILFGNLIRTIWSMLSASAVVIDTFDRTIYNKGLVLPFINWRISFDNLEYLLISQSPPQPQGRRKRTDPMGIAQEVWIHVFDGEKFFLIADLDAVEGKSWVWDAVRKHSRSHVRRGVQLAQYDTSAHHAALQIAEQVGVPIYLDLV